MDEPFGLAVERWTHTSPGSRTTYVTWEVTAEAQRPARFTHHIREEIEGGERSPPGDRAPFQRSEDAWEIEQLGPAVLARVARVAEVQGIAVSGFR